jgi:transposase-like protein
MNKGIRFTDEFKQDAVAQVVERGYAIRREISRMGILSLKAHRRIMLKNPMSITPMTPEKSRQGHCCNGSFLSDNSNLFRVSFK